MFNLFSAQFALYLPQIFLCTATYATIPCLRLSYSTPSPTEHPHQRPTLGVYSITPVYNFYFRQFNSHSKAIQNPQRHGLKPKLAEREEQTEDMNVREKLRGIMCQDVVDSLHWTYILNSVVIKVTELR